MKVNGPSPTPQIQYQKPVGESGLQVQGAGEQNSMIRVFAFETQHLAAQRARAKRAGAEVKTQDVEIKVTLDESGKPIAAGGQTSTEVKGANGDETTLNELALLSDYPGSKGSTAALFGDSRKSLPQFFLFDNFASRLAVESVREGIDVNAHGNRPTVEQLARDAVRDSDVLNNQLDTLAGRLNSLRTAVDKALGAAPFNNKRVNLGRDGLVDAVATGSDTPTGTTVLEVVSEARAQQVALDVVSDNTKALGVEGQFKLNDIEINVRATDSLIDLQNLINYGEDVNRNGRLDNSEDKNGNRVFDNLEDRNGNNLFDIDEDLDGDSILDIGEDRNFNGLLDVSEDRDYDLVLDEGTVSHGIRATIEKNVLLLEPIAPDGRLEYEDDEGILESLGLIEDDDVFLDEKNFKDERFAGSDAVVEVNGEQFTSTTNTITGAIEGVDLTIRAHLQETFKLKVLTDASDLLDTVTGVTGAFNALQERLNGVLDAKGLLRDDTHTRQIKQEGINAVRFEASPPPDAPTSYAQTGLTLLRNRASLHELAIRDAAGRQARGAESAFDRGHGLPTIRNTIGHFGIREADDGTIQVDRNTIEQVLTQNVKTAETELGPDGLAGRLDTLLNRSLAAGSGHLPLSREGVTPGQTVADLFESRLRQQRRQLLLGEQVSLLA